MATQSWEVQKCHLITDMKHSLNLFLLFYRTFKVALQFFPLCCIMTYKKQKMDVSSFLT